MQYNYKGLVVILIMSMWDTAALYITIMRVALHN